MTNPLAQKIADKHNAAVAKPGHNSGGDAIGSYVDRLVALEEEKKTFADDIRDVKKEAKDKGLDPKALSTIVKHKMEDADKRAKRIAHDDKVDTYKMALGLLD